MRQTSQSRSRISKKSSDCWHKTQQADSFRCPPVCLTIRMVQKMYLWELSEVMGVFATRSPARPNPIALTTSEIINIDFTNGMIRVTFIDANDNTPVLDIKPYTPSFDRVETPGVPVWCSEWPKSTEASGCFDWGQVFNF